MKRILLLPSLLSVFCSSASAALVQFDFGTAAGTPLQAGWTAAPLGNGTGAGVTLATSSVGAVTVDSRNRAGTGSDAGGGAEAAMWNDFVFANGSFASAAGTGLSLSLVGLAANTTYPITIWGFDDASNAQADGFARAADWSGGGGGGTLAFPDSPDPATLLDYNVSFNATADGTGALTITGLVAGTNPSSSHNVFINGLEIGDAIPEPSSGILALLASALLVRRRR